ncbi:protein kinase family protein [Bifidobacterium platyrrhinorum]|uniref:Uncharacterized protein n=1 Tax=Bifidobacterium platyrrhinorum TaxID=2661628 RepID=A0A6L9SSQ1_9BIFI|nr:hypothetical protein [Bifidobacterium platyrrhinorum]NEG55627.1 hypothetical protein [Bifidobacterium platyrrhinorum]
MKPQLGDTLFNRYTLVTLLRDEPGVQAWKANDRVLAHDCQLFVLTAPSTIEDISSLASQLGRKNGITPVLQFRRADKAAVLITRVETGLSLTEYLNGPASGTISFEAMRSIIGEAAVIAGALQQPRLSTDTIRISVQGVEIADAPLSGMLAEPTGAPDTMQGEQLAIRQLAGVLYALLTRTPSKPGTTYDLNAISGDIPPEFRVILSRGLELTNEQGRRGEPMLTLGELTALLGDCTPLTALADHDLALPTDPGNGSISTAMLRPLDEQEFVELPAGAVTSEKLPDLTIHRPLTEAEAARHAERVVAEQNRQTFAEMQAAFDNYSPRVLGHTAGTAGADAPSGMAANGRPLVMPDLPERPKSAAAGGANADSGRNGRGRGAKSDNQYQTVEYHTGTDDLFHDFSFQTYPSSASVPAGLNPGEETTRIPVVVDPNMATEAINVSAIRHPHDAATHGTGTAGAPAGAGAASSAPAGAPDMDATITTFGHQNAAAAPIAITPHHDAAAGNGMPASVPPSFAPSPSPISDDTSAGEDLSDQRLFGKMTTTVVVVIVAAVVVIASLVFALMTFTNTNSNPQDKGVDKNNQWPDQQNLDDVPFGDESGNANSSGQSGSSSNSSSSAGSEGGIEYINVTDAYWR